MESNEFMTSHLRVDCLETGISSGLNACIWVWNYLLTGIIVHDYCSCLAVIYDVVLYFVLHTTTCLLLIWTRRVENATLLMSDVWPGGKNVSDDWLSCNYSGPVRVTLQLHALCEYAAGNEAGSHVQQMSVLLLALFPFCLVLLA